MKNLPIKRISIAILLLISSWSELNSFGQTIRPGRDGEIRHKLSTIIIPKIDFEEATIHQVVGFLREQSKKHDPEGRGVNIILHLHDRPQRSQDRSAQGGRSDRKITLSLSHIPLGEVIRLCCLVAGLNYHIEPQAVIISDREIPQGEMTTRFFSAMPGIFSDRPSRRPDDAAQ